jgi:AbrB family looped-hinge helix DNA binding protein
MTTPQTEIHVGEQGRIVIPAEIRRVLDITPGSFLVARVQHDQLILEKREAVLKRLQSRFAVVDSTVSLVDELIAERRVSAADE